MRKVLPFLFGALVMLSADATPAPGQEKPKEPPKGGTYDQYVKFECLDPLGKVYHTAENVLAKQQDTKIPTWRVARKTILADIPKTARITDKNGKVYKIREIREQQGNSLLCFVGETPQKAP